MPSLNGTWKLTWRALDGAVGVPNCDGPIDASVPGDVHDDLVRAGILPEPLVAANCPTHEWVERALFTYERELTVESDFDRAELVFHGLDCLAEVFVNSQMVGSSANAFVPHIFDVTPFVEKGGKYALTIEVDTGVEWGKVQDHTRFAHCDSPERVFLRKPQFAFKWDWAPRLVTCGIWRNVELKLHEHAAIRDLMLTPSLDATTAELAARIRVEAFRPGDYVLKLRAVRGPSVWQSTVGVRLVQGESDIELMLAIDPVERWYPVGYGAQALYVIEVGLERVGNAVDSWSTTYGFREVAIRQEPTGDGAKTFIINVNGIDVFCKGANWVPADSIVARVGEAKYERLVREAVEANFNTLRIWGGGTYEDDVFYDLCDCYGVLVWHDFMFACAEYPDDQEWFVAEVRDEAAKVVRRLRHHPCIALWCGNNENDWIYGFNVRGEGKAVKPFLGQSIYHHLLPSVCSELDPQRPYWPSSPFGGDDPNSEIEGDRHAWNVSILEPDLAKRADFRNYRMDRGKFASEYGVLSYALPRTILEYTQEPRIDFASEAYRAHDNYFNTGSVPDGPLTDLYLRVGFGSVPEDELAYIMQSLAYQAMGLREAICDFRIRKFDCAGSLFWMYSDCWGTLGWTIIDYYLRRKPSFYWVRKAYAPVAVFVRVEGDIARSYVVNDTLEKLQARVALEVGDLTGPGTSSDAELIVPANGVATGPELPCGPGYALAELLVNSKPVSQDAILTRLPAEMEIPQVTIKTVAKMTPDGTELTISSDGFGHFVWLDLPDTAVPSDNYFNLLPGRPKVVRVAGCQFRPTAVDALNLRGYQEG